MNKSPWSLRLCHLKGITVQIHISLFVLLFWLLLERPENDNASFLQPFLPLALLLCLCLQGLGCILIARLLRISISDLTLYPFGSIYALLRQTSQQKQFALAITAPTISALLAAAALGLINPEELQSAQISNSIVRLFLINVFLTIINLMPILPLAGGHLFKALLGILKIEAAHSLLAKMGPIFAVGIAFAASFSGDAVFIFISATAVVITLQVMLQHNAKALIKGCAVEDAMIPAKKVEVISHGTPVSQAIELILMSMQDSFPIVIDTQIIGILEKEKLLRVAAFKGSDSYISEHMDREFFTVAPTDPLERALEIFELSKINLLPVVTDSELVGAIFRAKLYEFMLVQNIKKHPKDQPEELSPFEDGDI